LPLNLSKNYHVLRYRSQRVWWWGFHVTASKPTAS